jgi:hypothetical protein
LGFQIAGDDGCEKARAGAGACRRQSSAGEEKAEVTVLAKSDSETTGITRLRDDAWLRSPIRALGNRHLIVSGLCAF